MRRFFLAPLPCGAGQSSTSLFGRSQEAFDLPGQRFGGQIGLSRRSSSMEDATTIGMGGELLSVGIVVVCAAAATCIGVFLVDRIMKHYWAFSVGARARAPLFSASQPPAIFAHRFSLSAVCVLNFRSQNRRSSASGSRRSQ